MKKKLLLISAIAPFPQTSGGAVRIYQTIKHLREKYEIYFLSFGETPTEQVERDFLDQHCRKWQFFSLSRRKLFSPLPYYFSCWKNQALEEVMSNWLQTEKFTQTRIEFTQIAYLVAFVPSTIKKVFVAHDISTVAFARRMQQQKNLLKKIWAFFNWQEIKVFEKKWLAQFDEIVAVSKNDQQELNKFGLTALIRVEANGLEQINFLTKEKPQKKFVLGYIGSWEHPPNQVAIEYVRQKILPQLEKQGIDYEFVLAGKNQLQHANFKIANLGIIKNPIDFYQRVEILIAPIMAGSGTRIKILESLSFGVPVVTTAIGAEGITIGSPYLQIVTDSNWLKAIQKAREIDEKVERPKLAKQLQKYLWSESFRES